MAPFPEHRLSLLGIEQVLQVQLMILPSQPGCFLAPVLQTRRFAGLLTVLAVVDLIDQKDIVKGFARCQGAGPSLKNAGKICRIHGGPKST